MTDEKRVLLVDDDRGLLDLMSIRLNAEGYRVDVAHDGYAALSRVSAFNPDVVVTDLKMAGIDGMQLFDEMQKRFPGLPIIILTAYGTIPGAVDATKRGVFSFLAKPFDAGSLLEDIERACDIGGRGNAPAAGDAADEWRRDIVSCSPLMDDLLRRVKMVAVTDTSVFLSGSSGVGKELVARAIHKASRRATGPMIAVNCAAIQDSLLASELFGHCKGAFTGATREHEGLFQAATGGTLFLDEVGDIPLNIQVKLLRALQEREVRPVGSTESRPVDIRLISASWQNLDDAVFEGRFRQDLYYRLNVVRLQVPSLAERREDIPLLANHFLQALAREGEKEVGGFSEEAMDLLLSADWPGNVRQLFNAVEQAYAFSTTPIIPSALVRQAVSRSEEGAIVPLTEAKRAFEHDYLTRLLRVTSGNVSHAARLAGRNRTDFYKLLSRHRIQTGRFKKTG